MISPRSTCLAFEHVQVPPLRDQLLVLLAVLVGDDETALALGLLAEADGARVLGEDRRLLRPARLEQIRDARQTAGDVAGLRGLLRNPRERRRRRSPRRRSAMLRIGARRQRVRGRDVGIREA